MKNKAAQELGIQSQKKRKKLLGKEGYRELMRGLSIKAAKARHENKLPQNNEPRLDKHGK